MASERRVNVLFPIPLEIMAPFMDGKDSSDAAQDDDDRRDSDDDYDYLHLFSPKVYISGTPPDFFNDAQTNSTTKKPEVGKTTESVEENKPARSWLWPPFSDPRDLPRMVNSHLAVEEFARKVVSRRLDPIEPMMQSNPIHF